MIQPLVVSLLISTCFFQAHADEEKVKKKDPVQDRVHENISAEVVKLANQIDSFFGAKRALDAKNSSSLLLSETQDIPEGGIPSPTFAASLNLRLLNLEAAGKSVENALLNKKKTKPGEEGPANSVESSEAALAEQEPVNPWRLSLDQQVSAQIPPKYRVRLRATKDFYTPFFFQHFLQEYGWDTDNLWSTKTALYSDIALSSKWLFRLVNEVEWFIDHTLVTSSHGPSFIHSINERTSMSYDLRLNTRLWDRVLYTSSYFAGITFRRDIYKGWLFINLAPSVTFPRDRDWMRTFDFVIRLDLLFGDL